jgi:hypothetical protein
MIETEEYHAKSETYVHTTCRKLPSKVIVRQRERGRSTSIAPIPLRDGDSRTAPVWKPVRLLA